MYFLTKPNIYLVEYHLYLIKQISLTVEEENDIFNEYLKANGWDEEEYMQAIIELEDAEQSKESK